MKKPPLGLVPKFIRQEQRIEEIKSAIRRYLIAEYCIPSEWVSEYNELCESLQSIRINK